MLVGGLGETECALQPENEGSRGCHRKKRRQVRKCAHSAHPPKFAHLISDGVLLLVVLQVCLGRVSPYVPRYVSRQLLQLFEDSRGLGDHASGGVNHYKVTVTVRDLEGRVVSGEIEEAKGSNLPKVEQGADATIRTLGARSVIGTSGALFEQSKAAAAQDDVGVPSSA